MIATNKKSILLVEDEIFIAMLEKRQLEEFGYRVHHAVNGKSAVDFFLNNDVEYDVILMDIDLGSGINGIQAAEEILKTKDIPVIFLSSHTEREIVEKTEAITSYGYVVKNSGIVVLDASIKMALKLFAEKKERQRIEDEITSQKIVYEKILEHSLAGYWDWMIKENKEYLSPTFKRMFGYEDHEIANSPESWQRLIFPEDLPSVLEKFKLHIESHGQVPFYNEVRYRHKNGSTVWVICTGKVIQWDDDGQAVRMVGCHIDITQRKLSEKILQLTRFTIECASDAVFWITPDARLFDANEAACRSLGYTRDELLQLSVPDVDLQYNAALWPEHFEELRRRGSLTFESVHRAKDGRPFPVEIVANHLRFGEEEMNCAFVRDITERKQAEAALISTKEKAEENEKKYRGLLANLPTGVVVHAKDTTILMCNARSCELLGLSEDQMKGKVAIDPYWKFIYEDQRPLPLHDYPVMRILNSKSAMENQILGVCRDENTIIWLLVNGFPVLNVDHEIQEVIISFVDITKTKLAEQAMTKAKEHAEESEILYRKMNENSPLGMHFYTLKNDQLIFTGANPAADKILNTDNSQFIGKTIEEAFPHLAQNEVPSRYRDAAQKGISWATEELYYKDNRIVGAFEVRAFQTTPGNMVAVFDNITPRKQAEEEVQKQLKEKETLLKEIHHRVKNNIANIQGLLTLQVDETDDPDVKTALHDAISRIQSIGVLYNRLLLVNDYQDVSIKTYAESLIDALIEVYATDNITIERHISEFVISSKAATSVGIIINELITNVFKYAFKGRDDGKVLISVTKDENRVTLTIHDNGIGTDEKIDTKKSPGFGLTMVKLLVEQLHGDFCMVNEHGNKAVVRFEI